MEKENCCEIKSDTCICSSSNASRQSKKKNGNIKKIKQEPIPFIYELKIIVIGIEPKIWRTIQVPAGINFEDLHLVTRDAMGWSKDPYWDHIFHVANPETMEFEYIGIPNDEYSITVIHGRTKYIKDYLKEIGDQIRYTHGFINITRHEIYLEKKFDKTIGDIYPKCIDGEMACPPEDLGAEGYQKFIEIMSNEKHSEHEEKKKWYYETMGYKTPFDPKKFDAKDVKFSLQYKIR